MKIALVQSAPLWNAPRENLRRIRELVVAGAGDASLLVLPEMCATGFVPEAPGEASCRACLEELRRLARERDAAIATSLAWREGERSWNRFFFIRPNGGAEHCDKRHLFAPGGEKRHYLRGGERVVMEWEGMRFLPLVCYDLRFPVWSRQRGDYDMLIYVASWPESRMMAWDTLLRARAIENQCYVLGVNRVGADPVNQYIGHSAAFLPNGEPLAWGGEQEGVTLGEADAGMVAQERRKWPFGADADAFSIETE